MVTYIIKLHVICIAKSHQDCFLSKPQFLVIIKVTSNIKKDTVLNSALALLLVILGRRSSKTLC